MDKETWERALCNIFTDIYIDQLHKHYRNCVELEIGQVYQYLHQNEKPENINKVTNLEEFATALKLTEDEIANIVKSNGDRSPVVLEMAKLFSKKAYHAVTDARCFDGEESITSSQRKWHEQPTISNKAPSSVSAQPIRPVQRRGFPQTYISPKNELQITDASKDLENIMLKTGQKICHVYGMSGSGKSQLVRGLCQKIENEDLPYAIWHVQCPQKRAFLRKSLAEFLSVLKNCYPEYDLVSVYANGNSKNFVESLMQLPINILLVFEDSTEEEDKALVRDLVDNILNKDGNKVRLILVTPSFEEFYINGKPNDNIEYMGYRVSGFTEEEAVVFLAGDNEQDEAMQQLAAEISYSPFRMSLVKAICSKYNITYRSYYEKLGRNEKIIDMEKKLLAKHPNLGKHTYEVVLEMLKPADKSERVQKEVVEMLSFMNDVSIPNVLIGRFLRECDTKIGDKSDETLQVTVLLKRLENEFFASTRNPDDESGMISSIHKDILTAVRFSMDVGRSKKVLVQVLRCIVNSIPKDNRSRRNNVLLSDLMNHLSLIVEFAESLFQDSLKTDEYSIDNLNLLIYLCRACELIGFGTSQGSSKTDDSWFEKAIDYILKIVRYNLSAHPIGVENILCFAEDKNPKDTAEELYEVLVRSSQELPINWICQMNETLSPLTMAYVNDMEKKWPDLQWDDIKRKIKSAIPLSQDEYRILQQAGALLDPQKLRVMFLSEYLSSILHSRGRQMFYLKKTITTPERRRYEWYADVGFHLCEIVTDKTGVKSLFGYMLKANNMLHRFLVPPRETESDVEFVRRLEHARELAKESLNVDGDFYEHGKYKLVSGTQFTKMNALRIMVQANTKIYKRKHLVDRFQNGEESIYCDQLYEIARQSAAKSPFASNCLVYIAKYLGAVGEYDLAIERMEDAYRTDNVGINNQRDVKAETCAWALYNSGRVLYGSQGKMERLHNHCAMFDRRYQSLKLHKYAALPRHWQEDLDDMKSRLELLCKAEAKNKSFTD